MKRNDSRKYGSLMRALTLLAIISGVLFLNACYSIRVSNVNGVPEPNPLNMEAGYYRNKQVHVIDTMVNLSVLENQVLVLETCPTGFHSVEYKASLGGVLLSGITFGKVRKIKVKYVCLKEDN